MNDVLYNAAAAYKDLTRKNHIITFSNGETITLIFRPQNFKHLAGLGKFDDIAEIAHASNPVDIYNRILRSELTIYDLQQSKKYDGEAYDRIEQLPCIGELIQSGKAIYNFDKTKLKFNTKIDPSIIFFREESYSFFLILGVAEGRKGKIYFPLTFFMRNNDDYLYRQTVVDIVDYQTK